MNFFNVYFTCVTVFVVPWTTRVAEKNAAERNKRLAFLNVEMQRELLISMIELRSFGRGHFVFDVGQRIAVSLLEHVQRTKFHGEMEGGRTGLSTKQCALAQVAEALRLTILQCSRLPALRLRNLLCSLKQFRNSTRSGWFGVLV